MNIEESIQQIKTLIEAWKLDEADLNQTDINAMQALLKETQELREALEIKSYCKYANKCNEIYDCSREEYEDMANANMRLYVENQELKKQLENKYEKVGTLTNEILYEENTKLVEENQKLKQVNEEHRMLNGQLREEIKTKDKAYKAIVEELTEYAEENEKLKTQLSGTTFCYDEKEHRDLKVKIKELERIIELCHLDAKETLATINYEQESQQKEFIKFLEDEIQNCEAVSDLLFNSNREMKVYKEILKKYKKIVNGTEQN